ncbi:MAG: ATP--guanido phosphotransferase [Clostridia bacterium]|nr:ATP--guanido phosphotransferase [Clostridia bacterium]
MMWYELTGKDSDVVVSSRVRLARNLCDYPFGKRLDESGAKEIIEKVRSVFEGVGDYTFTDYSTLDPTVKSAEYERHKISREFAEAKTPTALIESDEKNLYIMLLEEDHIRIQSIMAGLSLNEAYASASSADTLIDSSLRIAYNEKLGYLTHCPTNLGTGMRASVMMFLPGITAAGGIRSLQNQLGKLGLTIRGMSGEGSASNGCLYQISNQVTLGNSECEILTKLTEICEKITEQERSLREKMKADESGRFTDRIMRSYGTMLYATLIDTSELVKLYADVRLGACLGIIDRVTPKTLDEILVRGMPNVITLENRGAVNANRRDRCRAEMVRYVLAGASEK